MPTAASIHWKKKEKVIRSNSSYFQLSKMCLTLNLNIFNLIYEHIGHFCFGEWWDPIEKWISSCVGCLNLRRDYNSLGALEIFNTCLYSQFALSHSVVIPTLIFFFIILTYISTGPWYVWNTHKTQAYVWEQGKE